MPLPEHQDQDLTQETQRDDFWDKKGTNELLISCTR